MNKKEIKTKLIDLIEELDKRDLLNTYNYAKQLYNYNGHTLNFEK